MHFTAHFEFAIESEFWSTPAFRDGLADHLRRVLLDADTCELLTIFLNRRLEIKLHFLASQILTQWRSLDHLQYSGV